jgi:hypothetical protein
MNKLRLALLFFIIALCCACSLPSIAGGGSSQQGNGIIAGTAFSTNGLPAAGASVRVRPHDYVQALSSAEMKGRIFDTVTDSRGHFMINGVDHDIFTVEINDRVYSAVAIDVTVEKQDTTLDLGNRFLQPYAKIAGIVDTNGHGERRYLVHVRGLERMVQVAIDGHFILANLPEGTFDLQVQPIDSTTPPSEVLHVPASSGRTTPVAISPGWRFMRQVFLNTTSGGAGVSGPAVGFPVCIRLTDNNFNFGQAQPGGRDLRFAKSDGTPLPYEIESWDSAAGAAVVWVRADTVFGNNGTQSMMMYWGASTGSATVSLSNGAGVFDTAAGFRGVWHLAESTGSVLDATANHYNGTFGGSLPRSMNGAIGRCQVFDGKNDFISCGNILDIGNGDVSISAWAKRSRADTVAQVLVGKSNGGHPMANYGYSFAFYPTTTFNFAVASADRVLFTDTASFRMITGQTIADTTQWHHIVAVMDRSSNGKCALYIDGLDATTTVEGNIQTVGDLVNNLDFRIGMQANGDHAFQGMIDEVVVASAPRSADWIKLEYMNQKAVDALVEFK